MAKAQILWDASGLVKRYYAEVGQETVNALFSHVQRVDMAITPWGYSETYSILLRRRNAGALIPAAFNRSVAFLKAEALGMTGFQTVSITDATIFGSLSLMQTHNINSADAAILATYLRFQRTTSEPCLLVTSDKRLNRAAEAEGLNCLNPEEVAAGEVAGWVA